MSPRSRRWGTVGLVLGSAVGLGACSEQAVPGGLQVEEQRSSHARITAPAVPPEDLSRLVQGHTRFALELYRVAAGEGQNLVCSPYSVSTALGMTWAGARGETATQMATTLHFDLPAPQLHAAFNALDQALAARASRSATTESPRPFRLRVVNALWAQRGYTFLPTFLDLLAENYGAGMRLLDFAHDAPGARRTINAWVGEQTQGRIPELLPTGRPDADTVFVLTNAVYFNAGWRRTFDRADTAPGPFQLAGGGTVTVPMMHRRFIRTTYAAGEGWQAVRLPYQGDAFSMLVIVPATGRLADFERSLDAAALASITGALREHLVDLGLPRFSFRSPVPLRDALAAMGMPAAFGDTADFSGMDGTRRIFLSDVIHQGWIAVDEEGTEAAGATAVIGDVVSAPPVATLQVDRPFIFAIQDHESGTVLFLGRVLDPSRS